MAFKNEVGMALAPEFPNCMASVTCSLWLCKIKRDDPIEPEVVTAHGSLL
jgi:hypothetical protein